MSLWGPDDHDHFYQGYIQRIRIRSIVEWNAVYGHTLLIPDRRLPWIAPKEKTRKRTKESLKNWKEGWNTHYSGKKWWTPRNLKHK